MATVTDYQELILDSSPLLYWPLNSSDIGADLSGNSRSGTLGTYGAAVVPPAHTRRGDICFSCSGATTTALQYSGTMDTLSANGLSVEFWTYPATTYGGTLYPYLRGLGGWSEFGYIGTTSGGCRVGTHATSRLSATITAARWTHCVFTQDSAGSSRFYMDGALAAGPTTLTLATQDMTGLSIDSNNTNHTDYWQHVAVYGSVLSAADVSARYDMVMDYGYAGKGSGPATVSRTVTAYPKGSSTVVKTDGQIWPRGVV